MEILYGFHVGRFGKQFKIDLIVWKSGFLDWGQGLEFRLK